MLCLGIESTAHTFACSVIKHSDSKFYPNILSDVRDTFKAPEGSGIHPREAARHHASVAIDVLKETLDITLGQLLDQFGRHLGLASPCGAEIERLAHKSSKNYIVLPYSIKGNDVTFSGILSAAKRLI